MGRFPVDAHVHLYPGADIGGCLSAAADNMAPVWGSVRVGVLILTESAGQDAFAALPEMAGPWRITPTAEDVARIALHVDGARLLVIAGRQMVTAEGLEVHGLGMRAVPEDRRSLDMTLDAVRAAGALTVLPWGVGKWTGARGLRLDALIAGEAGARDIFLADSGVRSAALPRPWRLKRAEALGWRVLAGTDPLPLPGEARKPGRFGFFAEGALDPDHPWKALAAKLRGLMQSPETYGALETLPRLIGQQVRMQIRKQLS